MSTSATARSFDFSSEGISESSSPPRRTTTSSADVVQIPRFPAFSYASENAASRMAARINASAISPAEHRALLSERQALLDKQFAKTITRKEINRLKYVRWTLDRVEDARYGAGLERLEAMVEQYEKFHLDITAFRNELNRLKNEQQRTRF